MSPTPFTYAEVGATRRRDLPAGYHHLRRSRVLGEGRDLFEAASQTLMTWQMHGRAGLKVRASSPVAVRDAVARMSLVGLKIPCRVVYVVNDPHERGFAYGTLPGHPETGEERFTVTLDRASGEVTAHVVAFSNPATRLARLGGPVARGFQSWMTNRYLRALRP